MTSITCEVTGCKVHLESKTLHRHTHCFVPSLACCASEHHDSSIDATMPSSDSLDRGKKYGAARRVFGTYELAEAILLGLPPRDLLTFTRRISKTCNNVVTTSIYLQKRLFYKQTTADDPREIVANPFAKRVFDLGGVAVRGGLTVDGQNMVYIGLKKGSKHYRKMPKKPPGVRTWSWEKMYLSSEPCSIYLIGASRIMQGEHTRLGPLMKEIDNIAPAERTDGEWRVALGEEFIRTLGELWKGLNDTIRRIR